MPKGVPKINSSKLSSAAEELLHTPTAESLGTLRSQLTTHAPSSAMWMSQDGTSVELTDLPPPWETDPAHSKDSTDARRFVDVPEDWELRWINPRLLDQVGWRDWTHVSPSHPRVTVKVRSLVTPDNLIRRGNGGDILAYMPRHWVESRKKLKAEKVALKTRSAVERHEQVKEAIRRGAYGKYVHDAEGSHPTHTIGDGRDMKD